MFTKVLYRTIYILYQSEEPFEHGIKNTGASPGAKEPLKNPCVELYDLRLRVRFLTRSLFPHPSRQMDDAPLKALKFLSQSTDSLHKISKVNESTESLTDEGQ